MKNIKNLTTRLFAVTALITLTLPYAAQAHWFNDDHYIESIAKAKITMIEAIQKASKAQSGIVASAELDDWGDEGIYYKIDIIKDGEEHEMLVNAVTGKVSIQKSGWFR